MARLLKLRSRSKERESTVSSYLTRRTPSRSSFTTLSATPWSMWAETQTRSISTPSGPSSLEWATESSMLEEMTLDSSSQPGTTSASSLSGDLPSLTSKSPKTGKSTCSQMDTARSSSTSQSTSQSSIWCSRFLRSGASTSGPKLMLSSLAISSTPRSTSKKSRLRISLTTCRHCRTRLLWTTT